MSDRILVGTRKGTFFVERRGKSWKPRLAGHAGTSANYVARDPVRGTLWSALGFGHWGAKLSRSDDDGATWVDATQVKYPEGTRYLAPPIPTEDPSTAPTGVAVKDAMVLKLWCLGFGGDGRMYVGTIPGGLFTSDDGGATFALDMNLWNHPSRGGDVSKSLGTGTTHWMGTPASEGGDFAPGIHSIQVDPKNPKRVLIAISSAGVLETLDGGRTWRSANQGMTNEYLPDPAPEWGHDPHCIQLCAGRPEVVWQQNHCGIFLSKDGARTWTKVSRPKQGAHFGFPIAADAADPKTAWVVPGKADMQRMAIDGRLQVLRTQNYGKSWEALSEGLPQECAYDVVYRHGLDACGDRLAFGSTTGNLYVSTDRGESWKAAAHNLPPIYSVRFG